jgi:hypothetical protein
MSRLGRRLPCLVAVGAVGPCSLGQHRPHGPVVGLVEDDTHAVVAGDHLEQLPPGGRPQLKAASTRLGRVSRHGWNLPRALLDSGPAASHDPIRRPGAHPLALGALAGAGPRLNALLVSAVDRLFRMGGLSPQAWHNIARDLLSSGQAPDCPAGSYLEAVLRHRCARRRSPPLSLDRPRTWAKEVRAEKSSVPPGRAVFGQGRGND